MALALVSLTACQKDDLNNQNGNNEPVKGNYTISAVVEQQFAGESKTALAADNTVVWKNGDAIEVYNEAGDHITMTTTQEGAQVSFTGEAPVGFEAKYAIYPASLACEATFDGTNINFNMPAVQNFADHSFGAGANIAVAKVEGSVLRFKNVCGALRLQIKGRKQLIGKVDIITKGDEKLNGAFTVDVTSDEPVAVAVEGERTEAQKSETLDCGTGVELVGYIGVQTDFYVVLPVGALKDGFEVSLWDETRTTRTLQINSNKKNVNVINRSKVRAMPVKTIAIDLTKTGETANSYIVPEEGFYCFKATVKGNGESVNGASTSIDTEGCRAAIIWETANYAQTAVLQQGDNVYLENGYIYFSTKDDHGGYTQGTAVIALLSGTEPYISGDNVRWSWHIWCTEGAPAVDGDGFMDRNLGAVNGDIGLIYQWGRKDPMTTGTNNSTYSGDNYNLPGPGVNFVGIPYTPQPMTHPETGRTREYTDGVTNCHVAIDWTVNNPRLFAIGSDDNMHWCADGANNLNLWGATKTMYDPCPVGYKVPDYDPATRVKTNWNSGLAMRGLHNNLNLDPTNQYWSNKAGEDSRVATGGKYVGYCFGLTVDGDISYCVSALPVRCIRK